MTSFCSFDNTIFILSLLFSCNSSQDFIKSPDSKIELNIHEKNGSLFYSVEKNNKIVLNKSILGILLKNNLDFSKDIKIDKISKLKNYSSWSPIFGEESVIKNEYNEMVVSLLKDELQF